MNPIPVTSSNVGFIAYDESAKELRIAFNDGYPDVSWEACRVYHYSDVAKEVFEALRDAESKGSYVCQEIAFNYKYEQVQ